MSKYLLSLTFTLVSLFTFAQTGNILSITNKSKTLNKDVSYSIYLPPSYEKSTRSYPVLYLFHGMWGDYTDWVNKGEVATIANKAIAAGDAPEMIIVMTEGFTDAFYQNNYDKSVMWEDYFINELMPDVESNYRIYKNRNYRAIAGLSMGGYGSVYHAIKHKDLFTYCYAMSGAFLDIAPVKAGEKPNPMFEDVYIRLWGKRQADGYHATYKANSIQEMIKAMDVYQAPQDWRVPGLPSFTIDCGDDDFLIQNNMDLIKIMKEKKIPVEFRVRDGGHTWSYWRESLALALGAVGQKFRD
ncbi:MAG TPA: alpha/beta hydrolase family protein [Saprospiraceae bacterium]|nr:alpha/beta hydrolase family protein [Saprospiraceae bacterium]